MDNKETEKKTVTPERGNERTRQWHRMIAIASLREVAHQVWEWFQEGGPREVIEFLCNLLF